VNSAIGEVGDLIGMAERKPTTAAGVTGVGGRARIILVNACVIPSALMLPTKPPPPSMRSLPFHSEAGGNQTSDLISESAAGRRMMETRQ